jgi:hypothetical protein
MYACMHACMHSCMHVCMHECMHVCMYVCMYVYIERESSIMYVCMYIYRERALLCMYVCMYIERESSISTRSINKLPHTAPSISRYIYIYKEALWRLYEGSIKALWSSIKALWRLWRRCNVRPLPFNSQRTQVLCNQAHLQLVKRGSIEPLLRLSNLY